MRRNIYSCYEDVMLERLIELNKQGYLLEKTGNLFKFKKTDLKVKYNICYEKLENLQEYHYIGEYKKMHYFYTTDLSMPDLPCDLGIKTKSLLKNYDLGFAILSIAITLLCLPLSLSTLISTLNDATQYYIDFPNFIIAVLLLLLNIYTAITLYATFKHREAITKQTHFSMYFRKIDALILVIEGLIYIVALIGTIQKFSLFYFIFLLIFMLSFFFSDMPHRKLVNNKDFTALLWIFLITFHSSRTGMYMYVNVPAFPATESAHIYSQNYYITKIVADEFEDNDELYAMPTIYYECRTEKAANAALKDAIYTFETNVIQNDLVDECYEVIRNDGINTIPVANYVFRKGTLVVRFAELNPDNISYRINEYIEYFKENKFL